MLSHRKAGHIGCQAKLEGVEELTIEERAENDAKVAVAAEAGDSFFAWMRPEDVAMSPVNSDFDVAVPGTLIEAWE